MKHRFLQFLYVTNFLMAAIIVITFDRYDVPTKVYDYLVNSRDMLPKEYTNTSIQRELFSHYPTRPGQIVMVGDSLVQYVEWHELLGRGDVLNRGIGGETTADLLDRIGEINSLKPRQIFLLIGTNDVDMQGVTADGVIARYRQIVEGLSRAGAKVVCLSIPMMRYREKNSLISEINQRIKLLEREGSVTYIELNERLAVNGFLSGEYTYDGVHLTGRGYRKIIDLIEMNLM